MSTTNPDPRQTPGEEAPVIINYELPEAKPPPLLEVGILAWMRKNLFSSLFDTILTIIGALTIVSVTVGLMTWAISRANWFVITFNFRQFMIGRFQPEHEGRIVVLVLFVALAAGVILAAYVRRISLGPIAAVAVTVLFIIGLPLVVNSTIPLQPAYMTAGNIGVVSGSSVEEPRTIIAFIGDEGEEITFRMAEVAESEEALAAMSGFMDVASNNLRNAAIRRITAINREAELEDLLERDERALGTRTGGLGILTSNQRAQFRTEFENLVIDEPVLEIYNLNAVPVMLTIMNSDGEPLSELVLVPGNGPVSYTLPEAGWFILEKSVDDNEESVALLAVEGIYPVFQRSTEFRRMTDSFAVADDVPRDDDNNRLAFNNIIDNQYRGERTLATYLRVYLAPFFALLTPGLLQIILVGVIGYAVARIADQRSPREKPRKYSRQMANWFLVATPIMMFLMVNGIGINPLEATDSRRWGGLLLALFITVFGILIAFPLGIGLALGRRSELPAIKYLCTLIIEFVRGTPFIVVLFAGQLLIPLINPAFADIPNVYRALAATIIFVAAYLAENVRGGLQSIPPGQEEAAKAIGLRGWQVIVFITLPQALRAVIPALVGQFISLFKDTSLLAIVGLIDLTGVVNTVVVQAEFIGARQEGLVFITIIYFVLSYLMSYVSRRIEESGSGSARRI